MPDVYYFNCDNQTWFEYQDRSAPGIYNGVKDWTVNQSDFESMVTIIDALERGETVQTVTDVNWCCNCQCAMPQGYDGNDPVLVDWCQYCANQDPQGYNKFKAYIPSESVYNEQDRISRAFFARREYRDM